MRKPGPILDDIKTESASKLTVTIKGRKVSDAANFRIDGVDVELGKHRQKVQADKKDADDQSATPEVYKSLKLEIEHPETAWQKQGDHRLVITKSISQYGPDLL